MDATFYLQRTSASSLACNISSQEAWIYLAVWEEDRRYLVKVVFN